MLVIEVHVLFTNAVKIEYKNCCIVYEMLLHVHDSLKLKTLTGISGTCNKVDILIDFGTLKA